MNNPRLDQELDPTPLVASLVEKTRAGRLNWQATADERTFIASVGGNTTLKMTLEHGDYEVTPVLSVVNANGRLLSEIKDSEVNGGLWPLYRLAQRVGNRLDEEMASLMEAVEKL